MTAQWSRGLGQSHTVVAGIDANQVRGASNEIAFNSGQASAFVGAGGRQATVAGYFEDLIKLNARWSITAGVRIDQWRNYAATSVSKPATSKAAATTTIFPDRSEHALSPRISALYKLTPHVSVVGSVNRAFRAPTLNELYRSFRVGNVVTLANDKLRAERLTGGEAGIRIYAFNERLAARSTAFWANVSQPVANVTLTTTPTLITRQRRNLGRTRSRGLELDADARLSKFWNLSAGYLFADAAVVKFPANPLLEGLMIPQVARHQFTFQLRYANPALVTVGLQGRGSSAQFDDDQNLFRLAPYFTFDVIVLRRVAHNIEAFVAIENLFNQRYEVGKTPVTSLGPPILMRAGFRFHLSK
jgi:outer membrane receptor protein involved in Fe transport